MRRSYESYGISIVILIFVYCFVLDIAPLRSPVLEKWVMLGVLPEQR